ncbi:hypothetical protein JAAARDRAFT_185547 [Jaapia argillacea MUCL 33604]|uniref:DUF590-domain-containing protein n=1 Tax=Jaapia argillacea MUCL 33604 TaxID=933084 RepID=A0A067PJ57_9AGAM|nr:hypothetical protein JAAARDRAFT_185547 [Jaapia argillacea MUCL 33604]
MQPQVDLVVVFRTATKSFSKQQLRDEAEQAELQYSKLVTALKNGGLQATARRGDKQGHLLILVRCPQSLLTRLVHRERYSDFLSGLPLTNVRSIAGELDSPDLCTADRLRIVHAFITSTIADGGLGIMPGSTEWDRVESVMVLHDHNFNERWIRAWTTHQVGAVQLDKIRDQFGEAMALYFNFLSTYSKFLIFPSALGAAFYFLGTAYSPVYSILLFLWSVIFVEYWRMRERILSVRWGTRGSFRVEKRRAQYQPGFPWWKRELRMIASVPVMILFAVALAVLLTAMFIFEAFIMHLYTGPGSQYMGFAPTILFLALVPRFLAYYQSYAKSFTAWENHAHQSTYDASLTIKTFSLASIVAYLGLALSAFIYIPLGDQVMQFVQVYLFKTQTLSLKAAHAGATIVNETLGSGGEKLKKTLNETASGLWMADASAARQKLDPSRLQNQMYAYTVTNQIVGTFLEVGLPFILRAVDSIKSGRGFSGAFVYAHLRNGSSSGKGKRVVFEDETSGADGKEEREFLEQVRREVALPDYELFDDYSEMVTQFGYIVLWSTIWPLAPVMAFLNNKLELRSDAFKITVHTRRPIPSRTDTIGPWLDMLTFITWLGALTNSALVYLFRPCCEDHAGHTTTLVKDHPHTVAAIGSHTAHARPTSGQLVVTALLIALGASHGFIIVRALIGHLVEMVVWKGSKEIEQAETSAKELKEGYLESLGVKKDREVEKTSEDVDGNGFWVKDEGLDEIRRVLKDA